MKENFNLVGDTFTHLTGGNKGYSVHAKESKYINWVKDPSLEVSFYVDDTIPIAFNDNIVGKKYAWILESKYIKPTITNMVKSDYQKYTQTFDFLDDHLIPSYYNL